MNNKCKILFIIAITALLYQCTKNEAPHNNIIIKSVKVTKIGDPDQIITAKYPGKVAAHKDVKLSFQISGSVIELLVNKGQEVEKDQLIAKIDPIDYQLKHNEAQSILYELQLTLDRTQKLVKKNFAPQAELDKVNAQYEVAKANFDLAVQNLKYTQIKAPFSGRIADTLIENHQYVNAKDTIAILHSKDIIDIAIDVPESIIATIDKKKVIKKYATFDSAPENQFDIEFNDIVLQADPETLTYRVYLSMPTPNNVNILPGMTATITINYTNNNNISKKLSYSIPVTSIFTDPNQNSFVWLVDPNNNKISAVKIIRGELKNDKIQITSGLKSGDTIVTAGVHLLREGQEIKPLFSQ